ncbi:fungal-specific transcription factor domain-containing protein [Gamsiella multidivaricata]|uniref:fungal-specific transcription factor domain-containing protein n=1 Tax=Gamsiella multidivaricata TaxID=101098 RepID=UPI00221EE6AF|nr:fungal-specific transcription factor domain-containing protein [Gamsiella multidivaricata]KAI7819988.1 fungal-specific transcription factor domain-containing protein [Gamsiella multidivaricata]
MTKIKPRLIARISCQECRRRKTRCNFDGQSQKCSTCARIGTPCIFSQKNGVVLDIDKVMEENNPHLVHQREKELRAKERARLAPSSNFTGPALAPASASSDTSIYSRSTPSSSYLSGGQYANRPSRSNSTSSAALYSGRSSSTEDLSNVMDRLQIDAFGIAPHTLRSFSQVAGDNDSVETSTGESSDADPAESSSAFKDSAEQDDIKPIGSVCGDKQHSFGSSSGVHSHHGHHHRPSRSRSVPLVDIQPDLIDMYFKHVHPFLLVLHKPSFFRRLYDPKDPVPDFLLAAMYAVASHYTPGREEDGRRYFQFWLSRLDDTLDKPRLSTIQALLMVIKYQEGVKQSGFYFRTYMYTQMVVVLARELQLHKTTPVNAKLDPESHEVRRRLFWAIFVLDQFLSVSQGRTMSFREVEPEADLPRTDNEDPNDPEEIEVIENAVEYIKLVKIDHQALILVRKFLTKVVTPEETIPQGLFLHQAMLAWKANLPARLQLAPNMSPHTPFVAMLHILYHACAVMIQRCYCEDPSISHLEIAAVSRETCTISATNITVIIDDLYTNHGMVPMTYPIRGCYFVIYCLIGAATVQVNDIRQGLNGPIMFKRTLALLNHFLRTSTAVDIEREVELLKSSMDLGADGSSSGSAISIVPQYDHRPAFKPILPMSQKCSSKLNFSGSSITPIRPRKISPRASSSPSSSAVSPGGMLPQASKSGHGRMSSTSRAMGSEDHPGFSVGDHKVPDQSNSSSSPSSSTTSASNTDAHASSQSPCSQHLDDELDIAIKSSPSPNLPSRPISSGHNSSNYETNASSSGSDTYLRSVPTFTAPDSLPLDFTAFVQAQQQALASGGGQNPPPPMSLAQFLTIQQNYQRLQLQKQQLLSANSIGLTGSLSQFTAAQIQEQHLINQQEQLLQLLQELQRQQQQRRQQQQQQQQDPAQIQEQHLIDQQGQLLELLQQLQQQQRREQPQQQQQQQRDPTETLINQQGQLMQLLQELQRQQQQRRRQQQQQQQQDPAQIQEQHLIDQQGQLLQLMLQLQQQQQRHQELQLQQQQQQQDPALFSNFLNNFSNLNNYQQLNSDQAQNELLSMLDSSMFNYSDATTNAFVATLGSNTLAQQQVSRQQGLGEVLSSSLSPSSTTMSSAFSPDLGPIAFNGFFFPSTAQQQPIRGRTASSDDSLLADAALARDHLKDTPSPETFPILDMASTFPMYLGPESAVPYGVRQALGDADKIFKFQAQAGLSAE